MISLQRYVPARIALALASFTAVAVGFTWALATGMVVNHPATILFQIDFTGRGDSGETVTSIRVEAFPGGSAYAAAMEQGGGPGLRSIPLVVDGGDPGIPTDAGVAYETRVFGYFARPQGTSYLRIIRTEPITLDNNPGSSPASRTVAHLFAQTRRANVAVAIQGAQLVSYNIYATASSAAPLAEQYLARTWASTPSLLSAASSWLTMPPVGRAQIYGSAVLQYSDGSRVTRSLPSQFKDLTNGDADVSWNVDVRSSGHLTGDLSLALPVGYTAASATLVYQSIAPASVDLEGILPISLSAPHYELDLPPATYAFHVRVTFAGAADHYADTPPVNATIVPGINPSLSFTNRFGAGTSALRISGFFGNDDLRGLRSRLQRPTAQIFVGSPSRSGEVVSYLPPHGSWQLQETSFELKDLTDPLLPLDNLLRSTHVNDPSLPAASVGDAALASFGVEEIPLVKSQVTFEVANAAGPVAISRPEIQAVKTVRNPDGSIRRQFVVTAYGASSPRTVSRLTIAAEPGSYEMSARAKVNGQMTVFRGTTLTFGAPISTPAGAPTVPVADDPAHPDRLKMTLGFQRVITAGLTAVVETALGPAPPQGLRTSCAIDPPDDDGDGVPDAACDPIYYDITSNATWTGQTKVCIRRRSTQPNRVVEDGRLALFHYDTASATWQRLPAPGDGAPAAFDCSADLAVCGCSSEADCGIDHETDPDHPINVFQLCGMTTSFSPFAVLQSTAPSLRRR